MSQQEKKPRQWSTVQLTLAAVAMVAAVILGAFAILWQINTFTLSLTLNGDREITIEYGDTYEEQGAKAMFQGSIFMKEPEEVAAEKPRSADILITEVVSKNKSSFALLFYYTLLCFISQLRIKK